MNRPITVRPQARAEFDDAAVWYEEQRAGLGSEFTDAIKREIDRIARFPQSYPVVHGDIRRATVRRFPYVILFRALLDEVVIVAIRHGSRDPSGWQRRS